VELRDYIRILRKGWILIAAMALAGVAGGALASILATPTYVSSTQLFVSVQSSDAASANELVQGGTAAQQKVRSYIDVVTSTSVLTPVIEELDLPLSTSALAGQVSAESPTNTVLMNITVEDTDPKRAAATTWNRRRVAGRASSRSPRSSRLRRRRLRPRRARPSTSPSVCSSGWRWVSEQLCSEPPLTRGSTVHMMSSTSRTLRFSGESASTRALVSGLSS
jgi:hypothetical protein